MSNVLEEIIIDSLSTQFGNVITGEEVIYQDSVAGIPVPEVIIEVKGDRVGVSFKSIDEDDIVSKVGSSIYGTSLLFNLGDWRLTNIIHDFTFGGLIDNTDKPLSSIFKKSGLELTKFTPDYVSEDLNFNIIFEGGTNRGSIKGVMSYYSEKKQKYETILQTIHESETSNEGNSKKILYGILVVGNNSVSTNLNLEKSQIQELQMRLKVGTQIYRELLDLGLVASVAKDSTPMDKKLKQYFLKLDLLSDIEIQKWNTAIKNQIDMNDQDKEFLKTHLTRWDEGNIKNMLLNHNPEIAIKKTAAILRNSLKETALASGRYEVDPNVRRQKSVEAHNKFEESYIKQNEGNMFSRNKAMINIPFIVMRMSSPSRVPSSGLTFPELKFDTVYDTLFYAAMVKATLDKTFFPDHEADLLEQYKWETPHFENYEQHKAFQKEQLPSLFEIKGSFNVGDISRDFLMSALEIVTKDTEQQEKLAEEFKGKTSRISSYLSSENRFDLALKGVQGKGLTEKYIKGRLNIKYDATLDQARETKPDWFHIRDTDTTDMDSLMADVDFYKDIMKPLLHSTNSVIFWRSLIDQSRNYHGENFLKELEEKHLEWLSKTRLFSWCKMITDIGTEVDISLKQNCKKDDFIFKKLQDYNVWLLIKPTKKEEKIFFSVLFKREDIEYFKDSTVFKRFHRLFSGDTFVYTNFVSLTESKLLNWVLFLPRMLGLFRFWSNYSNIKPYSEDSIPNQSETSPDYVAFYENALPMLMLTLIIGINDKVEVEEEITRTRYMVMESLSEWPIEPKPYKLTNRVSMAMRSRLTVWLYRKHKDLCHLYTFNPPRAKNEDVLGQGQTETSSQLFWEGFVNPYTGFKLISGQQVINLFYLGYIKNKDEVAQINKVSKLFDKILTYELQYDLETASIYGISSPANPRPHCFDIDLLIDSGNYLKRRIDKAFPENDFEFTKNLHHFLFERSVEEEFSTLKASSNFREELYDRKKVTNKYQRAKVIEKLALDGEDAVLVSDLFEKKYIKALRTRGLNIDIFKKPQHGGDREIYVLGFQERVVQRLIEQISRILCNFIPEETMTHPNNKIIIPENCSRDARTKFKQGHLTLNSSADASKWSQNNGSYKMLITLLILTPQYLHKTIIRCLRLWEFKRILINPRILELFDKFRDLKLYDETLQAMYDGYKGRKYFRWIGAGNPYVQLTTGMMQGILHYTSSLYHSSIISRVKELIIHNTKLLQDVLGYSKHFKLIMCHLQSSDDSYFSVSAPIDGSPQMTRKSRILATTILQFKVDYSTYCGVVNSDKSVLNSNHVFEFNSNFEFGFNHYKPDIKAVYSGFLVSEQELILSRQEELGVLLTTYIENGGSNYVANGLQIGQSYLHYHLIGLTTTKYFRTFEALQTILPDPSVGFFAMDNPLAPGLLGFKYNLWNLVKSSNLGKLFKHKLRPITLENSELEESVRLSIELSAHGSLSATYKIVHGNRHKWLQLLERMNVDEEWREKVAQNPEILFRRSFSLEEVRVKISQKMHSPGVSASLSGLNTIPRILAESAYILKLRATTSLSNWIDPKKATFSKVTLLEAIISELKEILDDEQINDKELKILFPFHDDFKRNQGLLENVTIKQIGQSFREYKRKETLVEIASNSDYTLLSLRGVLLSFWFEGNPELDRSGLNKELRNYLFDQHQKTIPWIRKDIQESLTQSPFNEMYEMLTWLNTFSGRRRVVRLLGTQIISKHGHSRLLSVVINNLSSAYKLNLERTDFETPIGSVSTVRSHFLLLSTLPRSVEFISREMYKTFAEAGNSITFVEGPPRSKQNDIVLMCKLARTISKGWRSTNSNEVLDVIADMKKNKHGTLGLFTVRQKVSETRFGISYHGVGVWEGIVDGYDVKIRIKSNPPDDKGNIDPVKVTSVIVNTRLASVESIAIRDFISSMKWSLPSGLYLTKGALYLNERGLNSNSGVPVIIDENYTFDVVKLYSLNLSIKWTGRNLRCESGRNGNTLTVLSISPRLQHYDMSSSFQISTNNALEKKWLKNKPLSIREAANLIKTYSSLNEEAKDLIRTNLRAKIQNQGLVLKRVVDVLDLAYISQDITNEDFAADYLQFQLDFDLDLGDLPELEEIVNPPEVVEFEDFDMRNVDDAIGLSADLAEEKIAPIEIIRKEVWRLHPLFRNFVVSIINNVGRDSINTLLERREYRSDLVGYLDVFEIVLNESKQSWRQITPKTLDDLILEDSGDESE